MPTIKKPADFWSGVLFMAIGFVAVTLARDYHLGSTRQMGPGYFPAILGGLLMMLGAALALVSLRGAEKPLGYVAIRAPAVILLACAAFGFLLRPAGLFVAIGAVVLIGAFGSPHTRWGQAILLAAGLAAASAVTFVHYLGQPLPLLGYWFTGA